MIEVSTARLDELPVLLAIRHEVFVIGQDVPLDLEVDGLDDQCTHLVARDDTVPVGTARLRVTDDGHAKAERVAVLAPWRGRGVGRLLMRAIEDEARRRGFDELVLHAQVAVLPFYERLGYVAFGPVFDDAGIPHRAMRKTLKVPDAG